MSITVVCATRFTKQAFFDRAALGRSLAVTYGAFPIRLHLFQQNTHSLGACYNKAIAAAGPDDIMVFVHDDVFLTDFNWMDKLLMGFERFDLLGVAGNIRRVPRQSSWAFVGDGDERTWDDPANLSGGVGHGSGFPCPLSLSGPPFRPCKLLDGVFLAARRKTFVDNDLRFDERFMFDFYDLDICRQFEAKGLRMGTIPLSLIHESGGQFGTPRWQDAYRTYLDKWTD